MEDKNGETRIPKILIVDDVPRNIQLLGNILMKHDFRIAFANNGSEALRVAENNELDLILLDVMMPGMDGFETCRRLKEMEKTRDVPVIFMTALSETTDKVKGFKSGAVDYITKPYEAEEVLARVNTHITLRKLKNDLQKQVKELEVRNNFIRRTFGRYLSEEIVSSLLENPEGLRVGGENLTVTILLSDIRGFSSVTEKLAPEQVVKMLNRYLSKMTDVILKYEGTIDEFIGDGILVIFGAPVWKEDHAERAVACALEMQSKVRELNDEYERDGFPRIQIGIGINTGEVVVGNIGSQKRAKYGVVGRNVNVASRIEAYTVGRQVLVSRETYEAVKDKVTVNKSMRVNPKGVAAPIELYDITAIGEPYNFDISWREKPLKKLAEPVKAEYVVLDEKSADNIASSAKILQLSENRADMKITAEVPLFANVKLRIFNDSGNLVSDDLYAKVVEISEENISRIHFTLLTDEAKKYFADLNYESE